MPRYFTGLPAWKDAKPFFYRLLFLTGDLFMVVLAYSLAYHLRFHSPFFLELFPITKGIPPFEDFVAAAPAVLFVWAWAISNQGGYDRMKVSALDELARIGKGAIFGTLLSMSAMFLYREKSFSRAVFVAGGLVATILVFGLRQLIKAIHLSYVRRTGRHHRVLIIGEGYMSGSLQKILKKQGDQIVMTTAETDVESIKKTMTRLQIHEVLVANPEFNHKDAVALAAYSEEKEITFKLLPDVMEIRMGEVLIDDSFGIPMIRIKPVFLNGTAFLTKRIVDVTLACLLMGIFFIPLLIISILIKITSPGPLLYGHKRMGYRGREFDFLKFRTMVQNADDLLEELKKNDRVGPAFKMKDDPRITKIGKFIRRFSIDEVPQVLNVLRGEMSLVGPRPQVLWEAAAYNEWAKKRLNVLPGITGLWQVSGRADLTYQEMIDLDIYYIEHWSLGLDIKILSKTIPAVLLGKGAY